MVQASGPDPAKATWMERSGATVRFMGVDTKPTDRRLSVILVREWEQQMSSSGCCGRFEGDLLDLVPEGDPAFAERREKMECAGEVYRALRDRYGNAVEIQVVDPRNLVSLVPILWAQGRRCGLSVPERLAQIGRISINMIVIQGRVEFRGEWPDPEEVLAAADRTLATAYENPAQPA